jgi:hypothetical protein
MELLDKRAEDVHNDPCLRKNPEAEVLIKMVLLFGC